MQLQQPLGKILMSPSCVFVSNLIFSSLFFSYVYPLCNPYLYTRQNIYAQHQTQTAQTIPLLSNQCTESWICWWARGITQEI